MLKHRNASKLTVGRETIRALGPRELQFVPGGWVESGSQNATGSVTCPPPKNGEGSGCASG